MLQTKLRLQKPKTTRQIMGVDEIFITGSLRETAENIPLPADTAVKSQLLLTGLAGAKMSG